MGFASGSRVAIPVIEAVLENVKDRGARRNIYQALYESLLGLDWDTIDEAEGIDPVFDDVVKMDSASDDDEIEDDDDEDDDFDDDFDDDDDDDE